MGVDLRWRLPTNTITNCRFSQYKPMTEHAQQGCRLTQRVSMCLEATFKSSFRIWEKMCGAFHSCFPLPSTPSPPLTHFLQNTVTLVWEEKKQTHLNKNFVWRLKMITPQIQRGCKAALEACLLYCVSLTYFTWILLACILKEILLRNTVGNTELYFLL